MTGSAERGPRPAGSGRNVLSALRRALAAPGEGLANRVVHGGLWQATEQISSRAVNLVQLVVLARLLAPRDFGLFGIALLTQQTLDVLLRLGIDEALIQREERTEEYLDTAWTVKLLQASVVAGGLLVSAPWVAAFFDAPSATPLIRVLAVAVALRGAQNIGAVYFRKALEFRKQFALGFGSNLANAVVAVALAVSLGSVWALMAGLIAAAAVRLALSYRLHPYRPRLELDPRKFRDLWDYGKWLFGSSTLIYASTQGDDVLLGRWLGAAALGVYQVAYRISNAVATEVTHVISRVTFPALSKLQSEEEGLRRGFRATLSLVALIVVPLAGAIAFFADDLVHHLLGADWVEAVGPLRILAAAGLVRALSACWGPLYQAQARTEKPFRKQAVRAVLTLAPAYPLTVRYGIEGMCLSVLLGISAALAYDLLRAGAGGAVTIRLREVGRSVAGPVAATVGTVALAAALEGVLGTGLPVFVAVVLCYAALYAGLILLLEAAGRDTGLGELLSLIRRLE